MNPHLSIDELVDLLYGVSDDFAAVAHIDACGECRAKLELFERRRQSACGLEPAPAAALASQRSTVHERIERPGFRLRWVPAALGVPAALAAGLVAAVVIAPHVGGPAAAPQKAVQQETAEDQLFREVFSLESAEEPRAASPIRGLFDEAAAGEQQ